MPFYTDIHQSRHSCTISPEAVQAQRKVIDTLPAEIESALDESGRLPKFATRLPFPCGPFVVFGDADNPQGLAINALTIRGVPFSSQLLSAIDDIDGAFFQPLYLFGPDEAMFHNVTQGYLATNWLTGVKEVSHLDLQWWLLGNWLNINRYQHKESDDPPYSEAWDRSSITNTVESYKEDNRRIDRRLW
jgi:hypothetical protein